MKITVPASQAQSIVSKFFYLAWSASKVMGMGFLQDRHAATEQEVFSNVIRSGDYVLPVHGGNNRTYADYVFGRMMKLGISVTRNGEDCDLEVSDSPAKPDYNSWSGTYNSPADILDAAVIIHSIVTPS
jgi:hypothetical protein